jgi:membrane-bound serine protease (ClpP class)
MKLLILITILTGIAGLSLAIVIALYQHKKRTGSPGKLLGELGEVSSDLRPEGAVVVHGELWRARSRSGSPVSAQTRVLVVGVEGHLLLVEVCE